MEQTVFTGQKPPAPRNYKHFGSRCRTCHVGDGCPPPPINITFASWGQKNFGNFPTVLVVASNTSLFVKISPKSLGEDSTFWEEFPDFWLLKNKKNKICLKPPTAPPERRCAFTSWDRRRVIGCHFVSCVFFWSTWSTWGFFFQKKGARTNGGNPLWVMRFCFF